MFEKVYLIRMVYLLRVTQFFNWVVQLFEKKNEKFKRDEEHSRLWRCRLPSPLRVEWASLLHPWIPWSASSSKLHQSTDLNKRRKLSNDLSIQILKKITRRKRTRFLFGDERRVRRWSQRFNFVTQNRDTIRAASRWWWSRTSSSSFRFTIPTNRQ